LIVTISGFEVEIHSQLSCVVEFMKWCLCTHEICFICILLIWCVYVCVHTWIRLGHSFKEIDGECTLWKSKFHICQKSQPFQTDGLYGKGVLTIFACVFISHSCLDQLLSDGRWSFTFVKNPNRFERIDSMGKGFYSRKNSTTPYKKSFISIIFNTHNEMLPTLGIPSVWTDYSFPTRP